LLACPCTPDKLDDGERPPPGCRLSQDHPRRRLDVGSRDGERFPIGIGDHAVDGLLKHRAHICQQHAGKLPAQPLRRGVGRKAGLRFRKPAGGEGARRTAAVGQGVVVLWCKSSPEIVMHRKTGANQAGRTKTPWQFS
jgi:hypothetical protein